MGCFTNKNSFAILYFYANKLYHMNKENTPKKIMIISLMKYTMYIVHQNDNLNRNNGYIEMNTMLAANQNDIIRLICIDRTCNLYCCSLLYKTIFRQCVDRTFANILLDKFKLLATVYAAYRVYVCCSFPSISI